MNLGSDNLPKLIGFLFLSNRLVIGFVIDWANLLDWIVSAAGLFAGTTLAFLFLAFLVWMILQHRWRAMRREQQAQFRRSVARERAEASRNAQLNKADFDMRLSQFVANVGTDDARQSREDKEPFVSRAEYWQCGPFGEPTVPKPIEFIRRILRRIAQVVRGT